MSKVIRESHRSATVLMSEADIETLDSYEDNIDHYRENNYSYIPMPDSMKYYDVDEDSGPQDMDEEQFIAVDEHIHEVLIRLQDQPFLLYDAYRGISSGEAAKEGSGYPSDDERCKIITLADLNKRQVKDAIYPTIAALKTELSDKIKEHRPNSEELVEHIGDNLNEETIGRWYMSKKKGLGLHIAESMMLSDFKSTFYNDATLYEECGFTEKDEIGDPLRDISELRHKIMHPNRSLVYSRKRLRKVVNRIDRAEELIQQLRNGEDA